MTIQLYVMRHGDAVMQAATDADRPLSRVGTEQVSRAASPLRGVNPQVFWASPYLRAQETAQIVKAETQIKADIQIQPGITPDDSPRQVATLLAEIEVAESILMVSHNPLVTGLVNLLVEGHSHGPHGMATASIALLEFDVLAPGLGQLKWLKHTN